MRGAAGLLTVTLPLKPSVIRVVAVNDGQIIACIGVERPVWGETHIVVSP